MNIYQNLNTTLVPKHIVKGLFKEPVFFQDDTAPLIIDAVAFTEGNGWKLEIFIPHFVDINIFKKSARIFANNTEVTLQEAHSSDWHKMSTLVDDIKNLIITIANQKFPLEVFESTQGNFTSKNCALTVSNMNSIDHVVDWIQFHEKYHNLNHVFLIGRFSPSEDGSEFYKQICKSYGGNASISFMPIHLPLGKNEPSETELWRAPDAPGKEKLSEPKSNPFHSEFKNNILYEIARARELGHARAVICVPISDIVPTGNKNIFDTVLEDDLGYMPLFARRCYPWKIRKKETVRHHDHTCILFEQKSLNKTWAIAPKGKRNSVGWNLFRAGAIQRKDQKFMTTWRMMGLRTIVEGDNDPNLAPKSGLISHDPLLELATQKLGGNPVIPPSAAILNSIPATNSGRVLAVTTMKNEGPFLLEWIAYHRAIGFDDFLVYTNDCEDGTDSFFDLLHDRRIVEHRQNPYREVGLKPQHAALHDAPKSKLFKQADWKICFDVDEYVNIHVGDGTLDALFGAIGDANMISMTWRLIGNSGIVDFKDKPIIEQFDQAAHPHTRFPHHAWGVKTLYRDFGFYKKMGVHRPKGLRPEQKNNINWVNGSGKRLPETFYRQSWRTGTATVGYDLVSLNHYAVRSMESFLVKRDRGRVNHVDRDQGLHYWFRMNHNVVEDHSIKRMVPKMQQELEKLMSDPEIAKMHQSCVAAHKRKIDQLLETEAYQNFFAEIRSHRLQNLSRFTNRFGMNVYETGPDSVPQSVIEKFEQEPNGYFNPPPQKT